MNQPREETKSHFLLRNLLHGLLWFAIIITIFILLDDYIKENFKSHIDSIQSNQVLLYSVYTVSEIVFGIIPPEFFMMVWILDDISVTGFVINLAIQATISYMAGVLGYYLGKRFSRTKIYQRIHENHLKQYEGKLRTFGGYLVFVGAVTPVPFSATCMLAGSVDLSLKNFLLICTARILRFAVYGWMVWNFPNWL